MKIDGSQLYAQMQSMVREAKAPDAAAEMPTSMSPAGVKFANAMTEALGNVNDLQSQSSQLQTRFEMGDRSVSLSDVMIASQKSSIAFQATVQVRNKLVESYKEIMNMPV